MTFLEASRLYQVESSDTRALSESFFFTAGSVVGREHVRLKRNNQDAAAIRAHSDLIVAAVADGCSSGKHSEIGARLAVEWVVEHLPFELALADGDDGFLVRQLERSLISYLSSVLGPLCRSSNASAIQQMGLFTLLVAIIDRDTTRVLGAGDGVIRINDESPHTIDPGPDNAPLYLGYRLVERRQLARPEMKSRAGLTTHLQRPTPSVQSLIVGTDGLQEILDRPEIVGLPGDDSIPRNPLSVQRKLFALSDKARMKDDTTVFFLRRRS